LLTGNWATIRFERQTLGTLAQFRHIFATLRDEIPATVFHIRLLEDMAECYAAAHKRKGHALQCGKAQHLAKLAEASSRASQARANPRADR